MKHECIRETLIWETNPRISSESISYRGKCPICGKEYEQVFTANDNLWDVEKDEYSNL